MRAYDSKTEPTPPMVTLKMIDRLVGLLLIGLILLGSFSWWRATRRALGRHGMMGMMPGMDPIWYLFGTFTAVSAILGVYVISRDQLATILSNQTPAGTATADQNTSDTPTGIHDHSSEQTSGEPDRGSSTNESTSGHPPPLTVLPEDERRVLEPVLESPGLTQVELRGRSDFSKAKVSQTISELEDRGLIYREKQGRTYRVYPGELVKDREQS